MKLEFEPSILKAMQEEIDDGTFCSCPFFADSPCEDVCGKIFPEHALDFKTVACPEDLMPNMEILTRFQNVLDESYGVKRCPNCMTKLSFIETCHDTVEEIKTSYNCDGCNSIIYIVTFKSED